jgi:hypothetical protein
MIGTWMGSNAFEFTVADIFPWDRSSDTFGLPLRLAENGINAMITVNNVIYALAGIEGKLFVTNGTSVAQVAEIPNTISNVDNAKSMTLWPGSIINHKGKIYFGVGTTSTLSGMGVYSFTPGKENGLALENIISTGNDGTSNSLEVTSLCQVNRKTYLAGWQDNSTYGIDKINNTHRYTSYAAFVESPFFSVGTDQFKRTFNEIEFQLDKPLVSGQGIKLKYRTNLNASYTDIGTYDFSTYSGIQSKVVPPNIVDAQFVQIKAELTTGASSATSPELRRIILR